MSFLVLATLAGVLVGLSRQLNGRLSLSTSPLEASFWNHAVGFGALTLGGLVAGGLLVPEGWQAPWWSYLGGPVGVVFVAAGSWVIARLGAARTALLTIAGQMVSGVALDWALGRPLHLAPAVAGVALILAGTALTRSPRRATADPAGLPNRGGAAVDHEGDGDGCRSGGRQGSVSRVPERHAR